MDWIKGTRYVLGHRGSQVEVKAERGVRQGCVLSPLLWSLFTGRIYEEFQHTAKDSTVKPDVVFSADDKHLGWILKRPSRELAQALDQFGKFLCLLRSFGLQASPTKSKAILAMRESTSHSLRKLWVSTFKGQTWLRIPVGVVNEYIPLVNQLDYLGIVLSYGNFKDLSWRRRQGVAQASFERIRKIMCCPLCIESSYGAKLWCLQPAMVSLVLAGVKLALSTSMECT